MSFVIALLMIMCIWSSMFTSLSVHQLAVASETTMTNSGAYSMLSSLNVATVSKAITVRDGAYGNVKSADFPHGCCKPSIMSLKYDGIGGCMKAKFDDLDLPSSTALKISSVSPDGSVQLLSDNITTHNGSLSCTLFCPSVFTVTTNHTLLLELTNRNDPMLFSRYYTGFKLHYWTTSDNCVGSSSQPVLSHDLASGCQLITHMPGGNELVLHEVPGYSRITDYIYVIKRPDHVRLSEDDVLVFFRLTGFGMDGVVKVHEGVHSDANVVMVLSSSNTSSVMVSSFKDASSHGGFYIRVSLWSEQNMPDLSFITGVYRSSTTDVKEWFYCSNSSMYIPRQHVCDKVAQCLRHEDEQPSLCLTTTVKETADEDPLSFLKWLLPVIGSFLLFAFIIFGVKLWIKSKGHGRRRSTNRRHRHRDCSTGNTEQDLASQQSMLGPAQRIPVPVPAARVPSQAVFIPAAGSLGVSAGSYGAARNSGFPGSLSMSTSFPAPVDGASRTVPISIPMTRPGSATAPIVIRPVIHRDASVVPPSYEEVTAEHSCGASSDSLAEEPDRMPEYHPPSYEDASQGNKELVSSWVLRSKQNAS